MKPPDLGVRPGGFVFANTMNLPVTLFGHTIGEENIGRRGCYSTQNQAHEHFSNERIISSRLHHYDFSRSRNNTNFGYTVFFYRSERNLPFATLISSDYEYDRISNLDRPGVFRLNIGVSKQTFQSLFGTAKVDVSRYDFTALDVIMPHPEYAPQYFVCVLSPSEATFERIRALLAEAYDIAVQRYTRRNKQNESSA